MSDLKHCPKCDKDLPSDQFKKRARYCIACQELSKEERKKKSNARSSKWQKDNPDKNKKIHDRWKEKHPEEYQAKLDKFNENRGLKWLDKKTTSGD